MEDVANQLIEAYRKITSNNQELIHQAGSEISILCSNSSIIPALLFVIHNSTKAQIRNQASITLKQVIFRFKTDLTNENIETLFTFIFELISKGDLPVILTNFYIILTHLFSENTIPFIFSFLQKSLEGANPIIISRNAEFLISIEQDFDLSLFSPLIVPMIQLLNSDINGLLLAFKFQRFIPEELFLSAYLKSIEKSISMSNIPTVVEKLSQHIKSFLPFYEDKSSIMNVYLPLFYVDDANIPIQSQLIYSSIITDLIELIEINDVELMLTILQKNIALFSVSDDSNDIFSFFRTFSMNHNFLNDLVQKIPEIAVSVSGIHSLLYCFMHSYESPHIQKYLTQICGFLSTSIQFPSKAIRETAAESIGILVETLKEKVTGFCPNFVFSILVSIKQELNSILIETLTKIFLLNNTSQMSESYFDSVYEFYMIKLEANELVYNIYPSFIELCSSSKEKSSIYFDFILSVNSSFLASPNFSMKEFAIEGIRNLALSKPERFNDKIPEFISSLIELAQSNEDDSELVKTILCAIGALSDKFISIYDFTSVIPILLKLVQTSKPYSSYALSDIIYIMKISSEKEKMISLIPTIIECFTLLSSYLNEASSQLLITNYDEVSSWTDLIRAMRHFVEFVENNSKNELYEWILTWIMTILKQTDDNMIISECFEAMSPIIRVVTFDYSVLFPLFIHLFQKEYDEELFPTFAYVLKQLIDKGVNFDSLIPHFFEMCQENNADYVRDFGYQILGQMIESKNGNYQDVAFLKNVLGSSLIAIEQYQSPSAAFVINQMACSVPEFLVQFNPSDILSFLLNSLKSDRKSVAFMEFSDNAVSAIGQLVKKVIKNAVPYESYLEFLLERMPAQFDTKENYEIMQFYLWLGTQTDFNPTLPFLGVLVRFFSVEMIEDDIGFIAKYDSMIDTLKRKFLLLASRISEPETVYQEICKDEYALIMLHTNIDSVKNGEQ